MITADDRRWLVAICVYRPTAALFEEIFLDSAPGYVFVTSFPGADASASYNFWSSHLIVKQRLIRQVPDLPTPVPPAQLNTTPPRPHRRRPWFTANR